MRVEFKLHMRKQWIAHIMCVCIDVVTLTMNIQSSVSNLSQSVERQKTDPRQ